MNIGCVDFWKSNCLFPTGPLKAVRNEHLSAAAHQLTELFRQQPRMAPQVAQDLPLVLRSRRFFKELPLKNDPELDLLRTEQLAFQLGIRSEVFDKNPGFEKFARENHLERYLMTYSHVLTVDPASDELSIMMNGQQVRWTIVQEEMARFPIHTGAPLQPWKYGQNGIQNKDMYDWGEFIPFIHIPNHPWGNRFVAEIAVCCGDHPHKTGDHGWLRLKTPSGDVLSVGLYRPGKTTKSDNLDNPLRVKRGHLMMPDVSEFWPCEVRSLGVEISEAQFHQMKAAVERDNEKDEMVFQLFQSNCVLWAMGIAKEAGVIFPSAQMTIPRFLTPRVLEPVVDAAVKTLPLCVTSTVSKISAVSMNVLQFSLGASLIDPAVLQHASGPVSPTFKGVNDIFDPRKAVINHPATFGNDTLSRVIAWRNEQKRSLQERAASFDPEELKHRLEQVDFQIPPEEYSFV